MLALFQKVTRYRKRSQSISVCLEKSVNCFIANLAAKLEVESLQLQVRVERYQSIYPIFISYTMQILIRETSDFELSKIFQLRQESLLKNEIVNIWVLQKN